MIIINNLCTGFVCVLSQPSTLQLGLGTRFYFVAILKTKGILTMMALEYVSLNFFCPVIVLVVFCPVIVWVCFFSCAVFLCRLGLAGVHLSEPGINIMYNIENGRYSVLTLCKMVVS